MKKRILGILTVMLALSMVFAMASCDTGGGSSTATVKVTYDKNGWTGDGVPAGGNVDVGKVITLPTLTSTATQQFNGWSLTGTGAGKGGTAITDYITVKGDNPTFYVLWSTPGTPVTITYDANGWLGTGVPTATASTTTGSNFTLPTLTAPADGSQVFTGWSLTADGASIGTTTWTVPAGTASAVTLYVRWQAYVPDGGTISIEYKANGWTGSGVPSTAASFTAGTAYTATQLPTLTDTATQTFVGWSTSTNAADIVAVGDLSPNIATVELYVIWTPIVTGLTIRFEPYAGYSGPAITITIGEDVEIGDWDGTLPAGPARAGYEFGYWEYNGVKVDDTTSFSTDADPVLGVYWSTEFTDTTGAEKVRMANGAYVIYGFDISDLASDASVGVTIDDLAQITKITVKQKINEASFNNMTVRGFRVYGPYAHNEEPIVNQGSWSNGDILYGDFKPTTEGMVIAKMNGSGAYSTEDMLTFNKFHPYMMYNNAVRIGPNQDATWANPTGITEIKTPIPAGGFEPDTWLDIEYPITGTIPGTDSNGQSLGLTLLRLKEAGADVLPYGTNYNKVYFAIGPSTENPTDKVTFLYKDVKVYAGTDEFDGFIPEWDGDIATHDQTFACYEDGNRYALWRGAPDATIVDKTPSTDTDPVWDGPTDDAATSGEGYFYLRLGNFETPPNFNKPAGSQDPCDPITGGTFGGEFTKGPLEVEFGAYAQVLSIALTPQQTALLKRAAENPSNPITVTLDGESTSNNNYRFVLGDATNSNWVGTSVGGGAVAFNDLFTDAGDPKDVDITVTEASRLKYFILQLMSNPGSDTITINSIKISYNIVPPPPPPAPDEDFVVYKSTKIGGTDAPIISAAKTASWQAIAELNAFSPIEFPENDASEQLVFGSYTKFNIKVQYIDASGSDITLPVVPQSQWGQVNIQGIDFYNLGEEGVDGATVNVLTNSASYAAIKLAESLTLNFQWRGASPDVTGYKVELLEIVFYKD